jgi:hypothetical protein
MLSGFFSVFKLLFAAPVAALLDEGAGAFEFLFVAEEPGAVEVDVSQVQPHGAARGNLLSFVKVRPSAVSVTLQKSQPSAGEDTVWQFVLLSRTPKAVLSDCRVRVKF